MHIQRPRVLTAGACKAGEPARLCALRSHFCRCSFCLEARDGPPPGVGTADLGDTERGGQGRVWKGRGRVCAWKWRGTHPSKAPVARRSQGGQRTCLPFSSSASHAVSQALVAPGQFRIWDHDQEGTEGPRHGEALLLWPHLGGNPTRQPLPPRGHL